VPEASRKANIAPLTTIHPHPQPCLIKNRRSQSSIVKPIKRSKSDSQEAFSIRYRPPKRLINIKKKI
jgi:hypothetical protein